MADTEVPDLRDTLLIEAMYPDADRHPAMEGRRDSKTDGCEVDQTGQPQAAWRGRHFSQFAKNVMMIASAKIN